MSVNSVENDHISATEKLAGIEFFYTVNSILNAPVWQLFSF